MSYRFEWSWQCHGCQWREKCVGTNQRHRTLVVGQYHTLLQKRRREQNTPLFVERMKIRNGIEATQGQIGARAWNAPGALPGKAKVDLQNQFIGAACNIKRWLRWLARQIKGKAPENSPPRGCGGLEFGILRIVSARSHCLLVYQAFPFEPTNESPGELRPQLPLSTIKPTAENRGFFSRIKICSNPPIHSASDGKRTKNRTLPDFARTCAAAPCICP